MSTEQQDTSYLTEAVEAFRKEFFDVTGDRLNGTVVLRGLRAAEPFFATHYEQKGAEGERAAVAYRLREVLIDVEREAEEADDLTARTVRVVKAEGVHMCLASLSEKETDQPSGEGSTP